jgi:drug/metabolite transporter (DMT)-like permease
VTYILTAIFLWSSLGIIIRLAGVPVHLLIFFSSLVSSAVIGLTFLSRDYRKEIPKGRALLYLIIIGPISLMNTFSFFYAYQNTSIANAILTHYTAPVIVAFLAPIFLREKLTGRILIAVAIASAGLWIMLGISISQFLDLIYAGDRNTGGILAGLFSGFAYAILVIVFRVMAQNLNPLVMTFFQNAIIALLLLPFVKITNDIGNVIWIFAITGIVHSVIAPVLYLKGMRNVTANKTAILGYLEPVCAIILGIIFLGEGVDYKTVIGGAMIILSGYITIKSS